MEGREREQAVLVIQPSSPWRGLDLREVWRYRELLYFFVWRDIKVRYKQTVLGVVWAVLQPLFAMLIFAFFFGRIARLPSDGLPYPVFAYAGLLPWTYFATAVNAGAQSLISSSNLVTKVYFPRILIPMAAVVAGLVDFAIASAMLIPLMLFYGTPPAPEAIVVAPVVVAIELLLAFGLSVWLSALVARYRDLRHVVPFVIQIWMFATPIIYPLAMIPLRWRPIVELNPMAGVIEGFRRGVVGMPVDPQPLLWAALAASILIVTGSVYFRRIERMVADVL